MIAISTIRAKQNARKQVIQALYQHLIAQHQISEIETQFREIAATKKESYDEQVFSDLLRGVLTHLASIDEHLSTLIDRPMKDLNPIELCVLRLGGYELLYDPNTPYRIILDESINLAKTFGSQDGHRYVNGVLHQLAKRVRPAELNNPQA